MPHAAGLRPDRDAASKDLRTPSGRTEDPDQSITQGRSSAPHPESPASDSVSAKFEEPHNHRRKQGGRHITNRNCSTGSWLYLDFRTCTGSPSASTIGRSEWILLCVDGLNVYHLTLANPAAAATHISP
jgi:hypothetical protein